MVALQQMAGKAINKCNGGEMITTTMIDTSRSRDKARISFVAVRGSRRWNRGPACRGRILN